MNRASQASTSIDRTQAYFAKPEHRMRPDFDRQHFKGAALKDELSRRWAKRPEPTNPDSYLENRA